MLKFAAKKAWVPQSRAELEEVDEVDSVRAVLEEDQTAAAPAAARAPMPVRRPPPPPNNNNLNDDERVGGANTNVVAVDFSALNAGVKVMTGEVVLCAGCSAALSALSKVENNSWKCEFCTRVNEGVTLEKEEFPTEPTVDYLIAAPPQAAFGQDEDAHSIFFVVDTSGSMCVTTPQTANIKLKGGAGAGADVEAFRERGADQRLPNEARNQQYVSRLQCVQAAVEAQIEALKKSKPNVRVGLVTFSNEVIMWGDGTKPQKIITGDKLSNIADLYAAGEEQNLKPISETAPTLLQKLYALEEKGTTALGPGLLVALGALRNAARGSKVVLCTDGLANVGVGNIENADLEVVDGFYRTAATRAKEAGVSISVVAIKGSACKMEVLGALADVSGGQVDIVDPLELAKNFSNIVAEPILATNVEVSLRVHSAMTIIDPLVQGFASVLRKDVGNVTASTAASFEFQCRADQLELARLLKELPFQIQVSYTRLDGSKLLRVQTLKQEVSENREELEAEIDVGVVGSNAMYQASTMAQTGAYEKARKKMVVQQKMLRKVAQSSPQPAYAGAAPAPSASPAQQAQYASYAKAAVELDDALGEAKEVERESSASSRRGARSDRLANAIYKNKK